MAGRALLQVLLIAVLHGEYTVHAQSNVRYPVNPIHFGSEVHFPEMTDTRINPAIVSDMVPQPSVRRSVKPNCAFNNNRFEDDAAPCIEDAEYNNNVKNIINRFLNQDNRLNEIVTDPMLRVILNDSLTPVIQPGISPSTRFGGFSETPVCSAQEELIFPQRAKTPKNDWVFVLNQENVKQALRVERCVREGNTCNIGLGSTRDVSTICRQKYVYRRMLVLGNSNIQPEEVLMPSCCVCYMRRNNIDVGVRVGSGNNATTVPVTPTPAAEQPPLNTFQPIENIDAPINFQPRTPVLHNQPIAGFTSHNFQNNAAVHRRTFVTHVNRRSHNVHGNPFTRFVRGV